MPDALWGTFSVSDHIKKRAFVADVLLYDKLVIPYPPDDEQRRRWRKQRWNPDRLERKPDILNKADLVQLAPWSDRKHDVFLRRLQAAEQVDVDKDMIRDARNRSAIDEEVAMYTTRRILCDDVHGIGSPEDVAYIRKVPGDYVEAVAAYTSYVALRTTSRSTRMNLPEAQLLGNPWMKLSRRESLPASSAGRSSYRATRGSTTMNC